VTCSAGAPPREREDPRQPREVAVDVRDVRSVLLGAGGDHRIDELAGSAERRELKLSGKLGRWRA
jgi:hypothetical protein